MWLKKGGEDDGEGDESDGEDDDDGECNEEGGQGVGGEENNGDW